MKIALVAAGGTIGSRRNDRGRMAVSEAATEQIASILGADSVIDRHPILSEKIRIPDLNEIRRVTQDALLTSPDAVIVAHGTSTLAYTSSYLAYAFGNTKIPIILCSADLPLTEHESNGYAVLSSAKMFAQSRKPGVFAVCKNLGFSPKIHHGARLLNMHLYEDYYNSIGTGAFYNTGLMNGMNFELEERKVLCIEPYVGIDYSCFNPDGCEAVVHTSFHSGKINNDDFIKFAEAHCDVPMFLATGFASNPDVWLPKNVVLCPRITHTALYIKLLIGLCNNVKDLATFVNTNACGEIVESGKAQ